MKKSVANSDHYFWGAGCEGWHLAATKNLSVIEEVVPPGASEIQHFHHRAEQFFYILEGVATIELSDKTIELSCGEGLSVPVRCGHRLTNSGSKTLRFIVVSTPPSHGDRTVLEE
ncbi:MAG: cupin domain-containing protein [Pseudomonadota bacterium]